MCNPGVSPERTDKQLATEARYHLRLLLLCVGELNKRGYMTYMRSSNGYSVGWPETLEMKKEVSL